VELRVELDVPDKDGTTRRAHLTKARTAIEKRTGVTPTGGDFAPLDERPAVPACLAHLLPLFGELSAARGTGMNGPLAVSYSELEAYTRLMGIDIEPLEVQALRAMDTAFLNAYAAKET